MLYEGSNSEGVLFTAESLVPRTVPHTWWSPNKHLFNELKCHSDEALFLDGATNKVTSTGKLY